MLLPSPAGTVVADAVIEAIKSFVMSDEPGLLPLVVLRTPSVVEPQGNE